jgi:hypothetical protein
LELEIFEVDPAMEALKFDLPGLSGKGCINLDKVEYAQESARGLIITMDNGTKLLTDSYPLDAFVNIWSGGGMAGYVLSMPLVKAVEDATAKVVRRDK